MAIKIKKPRSLLGYGYSTFVTLPKVWLEQHNLGRRDKVLMEIDEQNRLIITPKEIKNAAE